jgi:hypothetical protein
MHEYEKFLRKSKRMDIAIKIFCSLFFIAIIIFILSTIIFSCSSPDKVIAEEILPCRSECGKLIDTRHFREQQEIRLVYVSECGDTITQTIELNQIQLENDNGIYFYVNTFSVGQNYCES